MLDIVEMQQPINGIKGYTSITKVKQLSHILCYLPKEKFAPIIFHTRYKLLLHAEYFL